MSEIRLAGFNITDPKFTESFKKTPGASAFVEKLAMACLTSDTAMADMFFGHIRVNGQPLENNSTLEELLSTVNAVAQQENIMPERVQKILMDKENGLLAQDGKFSLPFWQNAYSDGRIDSQNRNRLALVGALSYFCGATLIQVKNVPPDVAKAALLRQRLPVLTLSYDVGQALSTNYLTGKHYQGSQLLDLLDGQVTIHFNGSRQVQEDEKLAVTMSMKGVDITSVQSLEKAYRLEKINMADHWVLRSLAHLWDNNKNCYNLINMPGCEQSYYRRRMPKVMSDTVQLMYRCLFGWEVAYAEGNHSLRFALAGVAGDVLEPKEGKQRYRMPKLDVASYDAEMFEQCLISIWERKTPQEWEDITGQAFEYDCSLNLLELSTQLYYSENEDVQYARQLTIRKASDKDSVEKKNSKFPKIGNAILYVLKLIEDNTDLQGSDYFTGTEVYVGLNSFLLRGEEVNEEGTTAATSRSNLESLLNVIDFDLEDISF